MHTQALMHTTPVSLLLRLKDPEQEQEAWARFVRLYTPIVYYWARRHGLKEDDALDLVQEVFMALVQELPRFAYDGSKSFRGWLFTITQNKCRLRFRRRTLPAAGGDDPTLDHVVAPTEDDLVEREYQQRLAAQALRVMQADFAPATWKACWEVVVANRPADEVASELGLTVGAVYAARFRVLRRLREELAGLLD